MAVYCIYRPRNNLHARDAEMSKKKISRVVSTPRHKYSVNVEARKTPLMLLFTYKQTEVIYVRPWGNWIRKQFDNSLFMFYHELKCNKMKIKKFKIVWLLIFCCGKNEHLGKISLPFINFYISEDMYHMLVFYSQSCRVYNAPSERFFLSPYYMSYTYVCIWLMIRNTALLLNAFLWCI